MLQKVKITPLYCIKLIRTHFLYHVKNDKIIKNFNTRYLLLKNKFLSLRQLLIKYLRMRIPKSACSILLFWIAFVCITPHLTSQTKPLKQPGSKVGIYSVDKFASESFDIYDKVYKYNAYAQAGMPIEDEDIDVLEDALDNLEGLGHSAPDILNEIDGASVMIQSNFTNKQNPSVEFVKI